MLRRQFVRAKTEQKSDGTEDIIIAGYDPQTKGYPFWVFLVHGNLYLSSPRPPGMRAIGIMEWKNPPQWDVSYRGRCTFPDENTRRCTLIMKDWKGKVLLEQESSAVRRRD